MHIVKIPCAINRYGNLRNNADIVSAKMAEASWIDNFAYPKFMNTMKRKLRIINRYFFAC